MLMLPVRFCSSICPPCVQELGRSTSFVEDMAQPATPLQGDIQEKEDFFYREAKTSLRGLILTISPAEQSFDFAAGTDDERQKRQKVTTETCSPGSAAEQDGGEAEELPFFVESGLVEGYFVGDEGSTKKPPRPLPYLHPTVPSRTAGKQAEETTSRFEQDFRTIHEIGSGQFGRVLRCQSRLDGCEYAVKCMKNRLRGTSERGRVLQEVYALAHLCASAQETPHIVRYHQAWIEDERLYIQMELCEISLEEALHAGLQLPLDGMFTLAREMLLALQVLHGSNMVHLDLKPANIFIKQGHYKLGDFGLVSPAGADDVEEGDSRYMPLELLQGTLGRDLTKCDIFSLGCTLYAICLGEELPLNGEGWVDIRAGKLKPMPDSPSELTTIITRMLDPEPTRRPPALELLLIPRLRSIVEQRLKNCESENSRLREELLHSSRRAKLHRSRTWT